MRCEEARFEVVALAAVLSVLDGEHDPAGGDDRADEEDEAVRAETDHHLGFCALRDAEDDRDKECEHQDGAEVGKHYDAFLPLASECASPAEIRFSRLPTTMNFVP